MFNFRQVDPKYYLSGGWQDLKTDPYFLTYHSIVAVVDLQYTPADSPGLAGVVKEALTKFSIDYRHILLYDIEEYSQVSMRELFDTVHEQLSLWEADYPKSTQRILVKCGAGTSRSPAALAYHLCRKFDSPYQLIINTFKDMEYDIGVGLGSNPNAGFSTFLRKEFPIK